jgi:zinc transporter ZupT
MSLWLLKLVLLLVIFALSLAGAWLLPRMIPPKNPFYALFIGIGDTFSGGIILAAGFLHMLPEGMEILEPGVYPFASLIAVLAILFLFSVDAFVHHHIKKTGFEELKEMPHQYAVSFRGVFPIPFPHPPRLKLTIITT